MLISGNQINDRVFLKNGVSLSSSNYKTITDNSIVISSVNDKKYLLYTTGDSYNKQSSKIEIVNEKLDKEI